MVRLTVMYPYREGARFDHAYYAGTHMDMTRKAFADFGLKEIRVDKGVPIGRSQTPPPYIGMGILTFETLEGYTAAFKAHGKELMADLPNFTDIEPVVQVSEVVL